MSDEKTIKLIIHYGGTMKLDDADYNYKRALGCKSVFWKLSEIKWEKFVDFMSSELVSAAISLIWFKEANAEMKRLKYVFDTLNYDMSELCDCAKSSCEVDVFLEHECSEPLFAEDEIEGGYEPDSDEKTKEEGNGSDADDRMEEGSDNESDDGNRPPKEDDDPEDSEDERPAAEGDDLNQKEADGGAENQSGTRDNQNHGEGLNVNENEVDDGDEVVVDAGNGGDDLRFQSVFEEGTRRNEELDAVTRKLAEEQAAKEKEEEDVETDPDFGLEDVKYPDTPLESEEEWEQWKNPKKAKGKEKFHGDLNKEPYIWLFQTFNSGLEFKDQLLRYSLNTQYDVKMAKSEANRIAAICCKENCSWKVLCSVEKPLNKWMVKVCHYKHNHGKSSRVSMLKQGVIGGLFREEIRRNVHLQAAEIKDIIKERYNIVVNISKCYKGRKIALDSVLQAQTIQFGRLWDYEAELKRSHKKITTEILTTPSNGTEQFSCFYICFEEFRTTWKKCCRPVIGLDGCFLKWDLEGDLLSAVGRDADNKMYPIAWAVVTGENKDTWGWFIQKLKADLGLGMGEDLTVISDKQKGLVIAVNAELPQAEHRMCARHIYANWKKSFSRSEYKNLFWGVAYSYHEGEYEEKMKMVHSYDPAAYAALLKQEPKKWCRAFFNPESHCADVHNNLSEAFNRTIKIARTKPVISLLEDIRRQAMKRISRRWGKADKCDSYLTPITMAILEKARIDKKYCSTIRSSTNLYEVTEFDNGYTVNLATRQCACRRWDLTGIPCKHAVCVLDDNQDDPEKYVADYYHMSCLKETYNDNIKPVNGEKLWQKQEKPPIGIPNIRKPRGRPKNRDRRKEPFESLKNPGKSTRHGRVQHCSRCGEAGHIKSGCKNEPVVMHGPKNRKGRPRKHPAEVVQLPPKKPRNNKAPPKPRKSKASSQPLPPTNQEVEASSQPLPPTNLEDETSSQPLQSDLPHASTAPQPSVSSNEPKPPVKKRKRKMKIRKIEENIPRGIGTFISPFTGRPFECFGDKVYDRSGDNPEPPL